MGAKARADEGQAEHVEAGTDVADACGREDADRGRGTLFVTVGSLARNLPQRASRSLDLFQFSFGMACSQTEITMLLV